MSGAFRYSAFISYSHTDRAWAAWLHAKLESYRVPRRLVGTASAHGAAVPGRIGRCFRDQVELSAASHLDETLQQALRDSRTLIIVCSPRSAGSQWVNEEIRFFRRLCGCRRGHCYFAVFCWCWHLIPLTQGLRWFPTLFR